MNVLDKIMKPKSIAVVGASTKEHTIGSDIMKRLQEYNFNGKIYPVNPKGGIIEGLQAYTSVLEIPGEVDLAIIVVNAKFVLDTIDQCHEKGIKGLCIITAGFKETGAEGAEAEKQLLAKVREYGMRCVGPNCLGVVNTHPDIRMDGCFAESLPERGNIGFVSQSGALGGGILNILTSVLHSLFLLVIRLMLMLKQLLNTGKMKQTLNKFFFTWNQFKILQTSEN